MEKEFTQGSIIEDVRSIKYEGIRCKGIVITARCDLAQNKVPQFHCLIGMTIEDWVYEVLYHAVLKEKLKDLLNKIEEYCKRKDLNFQILMELDHEKATEIMEKSAEKKDKIESIVTEWDEYNKLLNLEVTRKEKKQFMMGKGKKIAQKKFENLYNSAFPKYAFIPEKAYSNSKSAVKGIVVDLQNIMQFNLNWMERIMKYEIDFINITDEEERKKIDQYFFFEKEDDFVIIEHVITSPWIEYMMQAFANSFTRIGVDNATNYEVEKYFNDIFKEEECI